MAHIYRRLGQVDKSRRIIQEQTRLAKQLGDKQAQIYSLFALASLSEDQDEIYEYYKEGLSISRKAGLKNEEGLLLRNISNWLIGTKEYASALDHANRSREIFNKLEDKEFEANSLDIMGRIYIEMGDYKKTLECAMKSLGLHDEIDNERGVFYATNNIGSIYHEYIKDYVKALEYFSRLSNQTNPKYALTYHTSLGKLYYSMGDYGRVLEDWTSAHKIAIELGLKNWEVQLQGSLGYLHSSLGEMDKSLYLYEQALESHKKLKASKRVISKNLADIGRLYFIKKEYEKAMFEYFDKALEINNELDNKMSLANTIYINLCYRILGKEYDVTELNQLIDEETDINFEVNYRIFQLLGERSYLEIAYDQVKEKGEALSEKVREKFYDYPLPESIINAFEKAI
jgi:tetratricopeptide (TPR) repeat protein